MISLSFTPEEITSLRVLADIACKHPQHGGVNVAMFVALLMQKIDLAQKAAEAK